MQKWLWLVGLVIAILSAAALIVFPVQQAFLPSFLGILSGLALFFFGVYLRVQSLKFEIRAAIKKFAETKQLPYEQSRSAEQLSHAITLFRRGKKQRCADVITLKEQNREGQLFHFEYWVPGAARRPGHWERRLVAYFPGAMTDDADFQLSPEGMMEKIVILFGGQDIDFTGNPDAERFSYIYRLWGPDEAAMRAYFDAERLTFFANHPGMCVESHGNDLAVWYERGLKDQWQSEWNHSLRSVDEWLPEELTNLLEAARRLVPVQK